MNEILQITISLIFHEYRRAQHWAGNPARRHEIMTLMRYHAEEMGSSDYTRGQSEVPYLFASEPGLRDAWLLGFATAGIRDSVSQILKRQEIGQQECSADP